MYICLSDYVYHTFNEMYPLFKVILTNSNNSRHQALQLQLELINEINSNKQLKSVFMDRHFVHDSLRN